MTNTPAAIKGKRKFTSKDTFSNSDPSAYFLLPFRFLQLTSDSEIIVNDIGDFLIIPSGTVQKIVTKAICKDRQSELYADLIANFFISEKAIPELVDVISTRYRTKKSFLDNFTSLHIFVISLRCEHTCHYCQVSRVTSDKEMFDMSRENIDLGIEIMMRSPSPNLTMEFQGGEALLAFDNIKYGVEKATTEAGRKNKSISFVICTNLAPLTDDILSYCKEHNILISSSLDGPEFIHNKNRHKPRANSYQLAVEGIFKCREVLGEENVSALLTTTNLSLQHPEEIVNEYVKLEFRNIFLRPISPYGFATKAAEKNHYNTTLFIEFYKKALDVIINHNLNGYFIREDYACIILKKILTPFPTGYVDLQSPAGLINSVIVFNYDGKIYASDEARMLAEMKDHTFQLGTLGVETYEEIFYGDKSQSIAECFLNESLPGCSDCAFQPYCGADPVFNYTTQGDMNGHRPSSSFCHKNMEIIRHLFVLMNEDKRIQKIFRNWLTGKS
ncbi:His-Xaa-Ser system radical SAM maturase HxsB [uncultured Chitinophaga sp.]|uniref:His-Xaa-Ser system radical SAM maturase HxsB n=1 Tax=uncultured Chitinophaga sp. TaxID=339340 RepID=UPI0025E29100|nr:His-Xaa-Ser system radical SAM maturase HxsB [uncultured Chitinophaga sp.]